MSWDVRLSQHMGAEYFDERRTDGSVGARTHTRTAAEQLWVALLRGNMTACRSLNLSLRTLVLFRVHRARRNICDFTLSGCKKIRIFCGFSVHLFA